VTDDANSRSAVPAQLPAVCPHRRDVLRGAGVAIAGAAAVPLLAACGGSSSAAKAPANAPGTRHQSGSGGSDPSSPAPSGGGGGHDLTAKSAIPVGGGKVFDTEQVVVTQPKAGEFKCFTAVCTHMGCIVADVSGGTINCGCHGSQYNITTGAVVGGPAPSPLAPVPFKVSGGEISLT
jgi:Rieske Fe-S protein